MVVINGRKVHRPETIDAVRKYLDPNAKVLITAGKRKYLMPLDKAMRKQILPLAKPYPKNEGEWTKIDRNSFKVDNPANEVDKVPLGQE
jgi:hypothetical protein